MILGIITIIALANSWHVLRQWFLHTSGYYFTGIAHYYADYFLYTSQMAQGARGAWVFAENLFTNEATKPTWIYWFNVSLGHIGGIFGASPFVTYNSALVLLVICVLVLWYKILQNLFPTNKILQIITFLFLTTASNFANISAFWFSPTPALNRLGGVPHQIFQTILLLLVLFLFEKKKYVFLIPISFLAATASPIQTLLICVTIVLVTRSLHSLFVLIPSCIGALLLNQEFTSDQILSAAKIWETNQNLQVSIPTFLIALGPIVFLIPFGIKAFGINSLLKKIFLLYGSLSLVVFFSPLPEMLGTSPVRWLSPASYGILPILAGVGISRLKKPFMIGTLIIYILCTVPSILLQINSRSAPDNLNHIPIETIKKITSIQTTGVVLTDPELPYDIVIPTFVNSKSFTGHPIHTLFPDVKIALRQKYFSGLMTVTESAQFFKDHNITYVLQ